jgi:hypothetical protein
VFREEITHAHTQARRHPPVAAHSIFEAPDDCYRRQPSLGSPRGGDRLDGLAWFRRGDSDEQGEERGRSPASAPGVDGRSAVQGDEEDDLPRDRGLHPVLRAGPLPLRAHRNGMVTGPQHYLRLRDAVGRGRSEADQRVRGEVGGGGEAGRPARGGRGYDGAGGGHPLPTRNAI